MTGIAPGTYAQRTTSPPSGALAPQTGTAFMVGVTSRGQATTYVRCQSLADFTATFGGRVGSSALYDSVDVFFREGGGTLYVARNLGAGAVVATSNLTGASGTTLVLSATSAGTWGNALTYTVTVVSSTFRVDVVDSTGVTGATPGAIIGTTGLVSSPAAAVTALAGNAYATLALGAGSGNAVAVGTATALASGADGTTSATTVANALALFIPELGPGQVSAPGDTASTTRAALDAHATAPGNNRIAFGDYADATAATSVTALGTDRAALSDRFVSCVSIGVAPGGVAGASRQIPWSAVLQAQCAQADRVSLPGVAVAESLGRCSYVTGLVREFINSDRALLNDAGATVAILEPSSTGLRTPTTFSDRTLGDRTAGNVGELSDARALMAIEAQARFAVAPHQFDPVTRPTLAQIQGRLQTLGKPFYDAQILWDGKLGDAFGTGSYSDSYEVSYTADPTNRTVTWNIAARPSKCLEVQNINIERQV